MKKKVIFIVVAASIILIGFIVHQLFFSPSKSLLTSIKDGRVDGMEFGIGSDPKEMLKQLGKPDDQGFFDGSYYVKYKKVIYFTQDGEDEASDKVTMLGFERGKELQGVKVGMTLKEIQKKLGTADDTYTADENDELLGGSKCISYRAGDLELIFASDDPDEKTNSAYLISRKD